MSLATCCGCGPDLLTYALVTAIFVFAPIGAFVLHEHIASASGFWRIAGRLLQLVAVVSSPIAFLLVFAPFASIL